MSNAMDGPITAAELSATLEPLKENGQLLLDLKRLLEERGVIGDDDITAEFNSVRDVSNLPPL